MMNHELLIRSIGLFCAFLLLMVACHGSQHTASAKGKRVARTAALRLSAPPEKVFPLFGPEKEKEWAEGWDFEVIYSESKVDREGTVFRAQHPGRPDTIWVITKYDEKSRQIEYLRVTPDSNVCKIEIRCEGNSDGTTTAHVTYTYTAITERGNSFVDSFTEEHYKQEMTLWEKAINYYLKTGTKLKHY